MRFRGSLDYAKWMPGGSISLRNNQLLRRLHLDSILRDATETYRVEDMALLFSTAAGGAMVGVAHPMRMSAPRPPHFEQRSRAR